MKTTIVLIVLAVFATACGEKVEELKQGMNAMKQVAEASKEMPKKMEDAQKLYEERKERGDTVAMPYAELQEFLPSISGYEADGSPSGSQNQMGMFSMSETTQKYVGSGEPTPRVEVSIRDIGGSMGAYSMMGLPFMMEMQSENDQKREKVYRSDDLEHTGIIEKYYKNNNNVDVSVITRYRYMINVKATNQTEDNTDEMRELAMNVAEKFEGK